MKCLIAAIVVSLSVATASLAQSTAVNIIPRPESVEMKSGSFLLDETTRIVAPKSIDKEYAKLLQRNIKTALGIELKISPKVSKGKRNITVALTEGMPSVDDGYRMEVTNNLVDLHSTSGAGLFYAIQTFNQLLPSAPNASASIPALVIDDGARFRYRGMHLDISRHFQPVEFIKKFIDHMAQLKLNTFHWHLTDDQGWRIEIKKYPKLTEIGSKRPETMKERNFAPYIGDGIPHGGFYTQEQIKEVVAYAKERYITVVPEIELPGHASAALEAYPQLGCKADFKYKVQTTWGIFKETFCPTDETFKFLEDVLDETIKLFPDSPYIHIGGDEVLKDHWKESAFVQELKKKENLKDEHEVQSYFVRRMEKFINSKGKKMIGWDEILEGGVAPNATIMSWRGMKGGIEAAKAHHDVIMTPTDYVYFDYGQGDPAYEPLNIGSYVPLEKVYSFEPVPPELTAEEAKYIIGGQANIWTEYIKTPQHVEYMAFPRMLALAEVVWSRKEDRDLADFKRRLNAILPRLDKQGVNYRIPEPEGLKNIVSDGAAASIELKPATGTKILYTTDGSTPGDSSPVYDKPINVELRDGEVKTLKTIVVNSVGRKSVVYAATLVGGKMREPVVLESSTPGLTYEFLVPNGDPALKGAVTRGETRSLGLNQFAQGNDLKQPFAVTFDGYLNVPADGIYEFQVDSTWDATVVLGSDMIINDPGTKDRKVKSAVVALKAGLHKMSLRYNHRGGDLTFRFRWGIKGQGLRQAGGGEFVH